jgi:hypothetical protein
MTFFHLEIIVFGQVENISALKVVKSETVVVGDAPNEPQYRHRYNRINPRPECFEFNPLSAHPSETTSSINGNVYFSSRVTITWVRQVQRSRTLSFEVIQLEIK